MGVAVEVTLGKPTVGSITGPGLNGGGVGVGVGVGVAVRVAVGAGIAVGFGVAVASVAGLGIGVGGGDEVCSLAQAAITTRAASGITRNLTITPFQPRPGLHSVWIVGRRDVKLRIWPRNRVVSEAGLW